MDLSARSDCVIVQWDDQCVVYHRPSGQTHFINAATVGILDMLSSGAESADALVDRLSATNDSQDQAAVRKHVVSLLFRLDELGLIERVSSADAA